MKYLDTRQKTMIVFSLLQQKRMGPPRRTAGEEEACGCDHRRDSRPRRRNQRPCEALALSPDQHVRVLKQRAHSAQSLVRNNSGEAGIIAQETGSSGSGTPLRFVRIASQVRLEAASSSTERPSVAGEPRDSSRSCGTKRRRPWPTGGTAFCVGPWGNRSVQASGPAPSATGCRPAWGPRCPSARPTRLGREPRSILTRRAPPIAGR